MHLKQRIDLLVRLGIYMNSTTDAWQEIKKKASMENAWFIPEFTELAVKNISEEFLIKNKLENWVAQYNVPEKNLLPKNIGLIMAGNIPLVGFHDFLCIFVSGNRQRVIS